MDLGILEKCGMEPSQWASKAFPVVKGNGKDVRIVSDFKQLNKAIECPNWPTESSDQLLRNIESDSRNVDCELHCFRHPLPIRHGTNGVA